MLQYGKIELRQMQHIECIVAACGGVPVRVHGCGQGSASSERPGKTRERTSKGLYHGSGACCVAGAGTFKRWGK